ncbi:hypothetical protein CBS147345_8198 [Aspergillus niger]|nr:hypothetical protein CBS147345_8198 [Aspergillus niger]
MCAPPPGDGWRGQGPSLIFKAVMLPSDRLAFAAPSSYFSSLTLNPSSRPSSGLARLHHSRPVLGLMLV